MRALIHWVVQAVAIFLLPYLFANQITVDGFGSAMIAAIVLSFVNWLIKPLVLLLTLPVNFLTLGLFNFVINALMLMLVSAFVPGFKVHGFWAALLGSIVMTVVAWVLNGLLGTR